MENKYQKQKNLAREKAIDLQLELLINPVSYGELAIVVCRLEKLAKRFGLVKEFRENGII